MFSVSLHYQNLMERVALRRVAVKLKKRASGEGEVAGQEHTGSCRRPGLEGTGGEKRVVAELGRTTATGMWRSRRIQGQNRGQRDPAWSAPPTAEFEESLG